MASEDAIEQLMPGTRLWFRDDNGMWALGKLSSKDGNSVKISSSSGEAVRDSNSVHPANPEELNTINDLCQLSYLNEPSVLQNLLSRFENDSIYTFAGPVLIAVNPCKHLPLYTPEVAAQYTGGKRSLDLQFGNINITSSEPHIYLVSAKAFQAMVRDNQSQSLIVSGESGAGKTETTKKAMQYFTSLAGGNGIEDQVMETNPILEAFGNAKTSRNKNSSRFGKLIKILFNNTHHICGAAIETYLLEKSRVVAQLPGERNYHIFYQLVKGASAEQRTAFHLPDDPETFRILSVSGCTSIDGVDDAKDFEEVVEALDCVGITKEQQEQLFRLVAAVLWCGNLEFSEGDHDVTIKANEASANTAELLGCTAEALEQALTKRSIQTPDGTILRSNNLTETTDTRDALAKAIYNALFIWLVEQVNNKLAAGRKSAGLSISILDIFGFEDFQRNSFEQLCINYTNERLQGQFNKHIFTLQQEEYKEEGISHVEVVFENNQPTVDLLEAKRGQGILSVLDSQCQFPGSSDDSFVHALKQNLGKHDRLGFDRRAQNKFSVHHYAGIVMYESTGFLEKNKDTLSGDLVALMLGSSLVLLAELGKSLEGQAGGGKGKATVGMRFSGQLATLMTYLDTTGLHFIRCIKPNPQLRADTFAHDMVELQLRSCGVLEVVRLAKAGFPSRYEFLTFAERYSVLTHKQQSAIREGETAKDACVRLLKEFEVGEDQYVIGNSKVFFRPGVVGRIEVQWAYQMRMSALLQTSCRCWRWRTWFGNLRRAAIATQSAIRVENARREFAELKRRNDGATKIQRAWRSKRLRASWGQIAKAVVVLQMFARRWRFRNRVAQRVHIREKAELEVRLAAEEAKRKEESFGNLREQYGLSIEQVRDAVERYVSGAPPPPSIASLPAAPPPPPAPAPTATRSVPPPPPGNPTTEAGDVPDSVKMRLENLVLRQKLRLQSGLREQYQAQARERAAADLASKVRELQDYIRLVQSSPSSPLPPPPPFIDVSASLAAASAAGSSNNFALIPEEAPEPEPEVKKPSNAELAAAAVPSGMVKARLNDVASGTVEGPAVVKTVAAPSEKMGEELLQYHVQQALEACKDDFDKTVRVLEDNAEFIKEATQGSTPAEGLDTEKEYQLLESQFKVWQYEFYEKLKGLRKLLRGNGSTAISALRQRFESMERQSSSAVQRSVSRVTSRQASTRPTAAAEAAEE